MNSHALRQLLSARLTMGLLGLWVILEVLRSLVFNSDGFYFGFGLSRGGMRELLLWQPLSYGLIHGGWLHLLTNAMLLLALGTRMEWMLGTRVLGLVLLAGALFGALLHLALSPNVLVGGSGAVFAVLLCITGLSPESKILTPLPLSAKNLGRGLIIASLALTLINPDYGIPGLAHLGEKLNRVGFEGLFRISHACHLGGAMAGWLSARWILRSRVSLDQLQRERARREG